MLPPTPQELRKAAMRKIRRGRPVKTIRKEETRLRRAMGDLWHQVLLPATERIKQLVRQNASPTAIADEIENTLRLANTTYGRLAEGIIDRWAAGVDREVQIAINRTMHQALGVDITAMLQQPDVRDAMSVAGMRATNLITSIPQQYLGQVAQAVADNFSGTPLPEGRSLLEQIQHIGGVSYRRAKLIARDQTSKLTAALAQTRQEAVGIDTYIWRTVHDERVVGDPNGVSPVGNPKHGDHYHMDGLTFSWKDNEVYSDDQGQTWKKRPATWSRSIPGHDIQCRCWAEPIVDPAKVIAHVEAQRSYR